MTAVKWLEQQIKDTFYVAEASEMAKRFEGMFEQAKEMEKQQMIKFYIKGCIDTYGMDEGTDDIKDAENYYNETYGSETKTDNI